MLQDFVSSWFSIVQNGELVTAMDPQVFLRVSITSLGLRIPVTSSKAERSRIHSSSLPCSCEIRLRGFPVQTASVPLISSPEAQPDPQCIATSFYLEESDLKEMLAPGCFQATNAYLEITVFMGRQGSHCGVSSRKQQIGSFKLQVGPEWGEGKSLMLHSGWISIGKKHQEGEKAEAELHLRVKLDPDPRYVFQFEDETALSPQIVQLQGSIKQPIFTCKFSRDRRTSQLDQRKYWLSSTGGDDAESERRERKGWRVMIHDLSGSPVAAAFMATPFVPSTGCDRVARSNPGAWLILRPDACGADSWQPWGRLEAWRERGSRDSVCCRLHLLSEGQEGGILVSEILISTDKGGEFLIDMDKQTPSGTPVPSPQSSGDFAAVGPIIGGFVMKCKVQGEGRSSKPIVQLAMRHVTCVEDAAIFMALAAAVDLSMEACRPFRRKGLKGRTWTRNSL
ncbi:hypothetical protein H6P81_005830 [Aristolochia fimbriata]|uniref:Uncharacterized protein n=1 Tax=Aristolochia fimbriata TaxID=158543 RepID=A0AAV7EZB0_ARIFI|nr:hypothetical protein H6P81_005830 [Aristolochia fimbriata]